MNTKHPTLFPRPLLLAALAISVLGAGLRAETDSADMEAARDRIIERLPEMENLWNRGLTGESNEGFVVARSSLGRTQIELVQAENRDRAILYSHVAKKTGSDMFSVGRERAIQIANMAKNGLWIQRGDGDWQRK